MSRGEHFSGENMKRTTLSARFLAGFEPTVLPPRGPEGMIPAGPPKKLPVVDPPSLCEAGPCRNYHRIRSVMDAEDGGIPGADHLQVSRACYPTPGIEIELGETPVLQCSRWEPDSEQSRLDAIRTNFLKSADGKAFTAHMNTFEASNAAARAGEIVTPEALPEPLPLTPTAPISVPTPAAVEVPSDDFGFDASDAGLDALEEDEVMP